MRWKTRGRGWREMQDEEQHVLEVHEIGITKRVRRVRRKTHRVNPRWIKIYTARKLKRDSVVQIDCSSVLSSQLGSSSAFRLNRFILPHKSYFVVWLDDTA